jgi:hypothetical protein
MEHVAQSLYMKRTWFGRIAHYVLTGCWCEKNVGIAYEGNRVFVRCNDCLAQSKGITVKTKPLS